VAIGQHRHEDADDALCAALQRHSALPLREAEDKEAILPGRVYVAPAGYHLLVEEGRFALSTEAPVSYARPCIDVLFESAADVYAAGVIGVILTGASKDGAHGAAKIKAHGGFVVVQDPRTAESPVMPEAAIAATNVDRILPLAEIAPFVAALRRSRRR
jgi:two-component system, chemotaxis family, protein-glutamate methylesterase/glutaminase